MFSTRELLDSPFLQSVRPALARVPSETEDWPSLADLQGVLDGSPRPPCSARGQPVRLVAQAARARSPEERYEARIYLKSELQTRERDWHDLFNALVWASFPQTKAALNARHYAEAAQRPCGNRSAVQDALTLFDEGGVIVLSAQPALARLLLEFRWKELFWQRREEVRERMAFLLFGHALMQHCLAPFVGLTAKALLLDCDTALLQLPAAERLTRIDALAAARVAEPLAFTRGRDLAPLPILGVPGWWPANESAEFYDDARYFRAGRRES